MTWFGTSHFVNKASAVKYYDMMQGYDSAEVEQYIKEGNIHIGPPKLEPGQTLRVISDEGRYAIEEK